MICSICFNLSKFFVFMKLNATRRFLSHFFRSISKKNINFFTYSQLKKYIYINFIYLKLWVNANVCISYL